MAPDFQFPNIFEDGFKRYLTYSCACCKREGNLDRV